MEESVTDEVGVFLKKAAVGWAAAFEYVIWIFLQNISR